MTKDQVDGLLGKPTETLTVSPGEIEYLAGGGTSRIYRPVTSPYDVEIVFDTLGLSRGVILLSTGPENVPCAQAAKLIAKVGVTVPTKADSEAPMARRWVRQNGYSVLVVCPNPSGNVSVVQVWRVP